MILLLCLCLQSWLWSRWHLSSLLCPDWRLLLLLLLFRLIRSFIAIDGVMVLISVELLCLILSCDVDNTVRTGVPARRRASMREQALARCDNVSKRIHQVTVLLSIVIIWAQGWDFMVSLVNLLILKRKIVPSSLASRWSRSWPSIVCFVFFTLLSSLIWSTSTLRHLGRSVHKHMRWLLRDFSTFTQRFFSCDDTKWGYWATSGAHRGEIMSIMIDILVTSTTFR